MEVFLVSIVVFLSTNALNEYDFLTYLYVFGLGTAVFFLPNFG